ncbi:AAA family ATPase [Nostoc edaphicum CCNP1411]|uniref:AAA family ATPase n=2 Tax=Nostoc TaxID=1177 RepID=A0A7D7R7N3_9NOSO|nr:AAA family ATPase [Nostoc edaphicum CCNP1411]
MTQYNALINSNITDYLDFYCDLVYAPGFAVLLKGEWGSGKTWFIKKYCKSIKEKNRKYLYVSLSGVTTFSQIEEAFLQAKIPILSSKPIALLRSLITQALKSTVIMDINGDNKADGSLTLGSTSDSLAKYLINLDETILIFDDLERCDMSISSVLGYINSFIEHQELKVIIVANEVLLEEKSNYKEIKEKLIGITFEIALDFEGALENFIIKLKNPNVSKFLSDNTELIQDLYDKAQCGNLRILKQIVLDFERIFDTLSEQAKNKPELLQDILKLLIAFSIEIRRAKILPKDIGSLLQEYANIFVNNIHNSSYRPPSSSINEDSSKKTPVQEILRKYHPLKLYDPFPSAIWWQTFFDKGALDAKELERSLSISQYFQDENAPDWVRLYYFSNLTEEQFDYYLKKVESEYTNINTNTNIFDIGVIKHITALFLKFSDAGLYNSTKENILDKSKLYIDYLKDTRQLDITSQSVLSCEHYDRLSFYVNKSPEFQDFCCYINQVIKLARVENLPNVAQELLTIMQTNVEVFSSMIHVGNFHIRDSSEPKYYEVPIFKYIQPYNFAEKFLSMKFQQQQSVCWAIAERYDIDKFNEKLIEELEWLKDVRSLLLKSAHTKGKLTEYRLKSLIENNWNEVIQKLEVIAHRLQQQQLENKPT